MCDAERLIEQRCGGAFRIAHIARELGVTAYVLRAHFVRLHGHAPLAHLHEARVRHAAVLLRTSDLILDAVTSLCGFDSASHLSHRVKRAADRNRESLRVE